MASSSERRRTGGDTAPLAIGLDDVQRAAALIEGSVERTPCRHSRTLSAICGAELWLKFENLQFTASFKERGAFNKLLSLNDEQRARGVIAMSAGNHAQGVAYHAGRLGIPAVIVMPEGTPAVKADNTARLGAEVVITGGSLEEAGAYAFERAERDGLTFVHPYDDPLVMAGQGTVALEMLDQAPGLDALVVPLGGGGLIAGMAVAAKALRPEIEVIGVESELYPSMRNALSGSSLPMDGDTLAEGIAVKAPGKLTEPVCRALVDEVLLADERHLERAVYLLLTIEKTVAEGAGAAGLAAVLAHPKIFAGKRVGLVICGGNIDTRLLAGVLLRELAREGRLARLRVRLKDRPGQLAKLVAAVADEGANLVEVSHARTFTDLPAKSVYAVVEVETRDAAHRDRLIARLKSQGFELALTGPDNVGE